MATADIIIKLDDSDRELIRRLTDALEGARPPRSNSVEPFVGPPDVNQGEPAALARPATLSELKAWIKEQFHLDEERWQYGDFGQGMMTAAEKILQRIDDLDQGPIASKLTGESLLRMVSKVGESDGIDV